MPASRFSLAFGAAAATIALTAGAAPAADDATQLNRVEVAGQTLAAPIRYDVHAACASIEEDLQRPLYKAWAREQRPAEINVSFVLRGQEISDVRAQGDASGYRQDVRRAVHQLRCASAQASATPQVYTFQVAFLDEAGRQQQAAAGKPYRIALLKR